MACPRNEYVVGVRGGKVVILLPPIAEEQIDKESALGLIAWLAVLSEIPVNDILQAIHEVEDT